MATAASMTPVGKKVWKEWGTLHDHDPSPVKRIARRLNMNPADVAAIVFPRLQEFGLWSDDSEEDVTSDTWAPTPEYVADNVVDAARYLQGLINKLAQEQNSYYTYGDLVTDLNEALPNLEALIDLAAMAKEMS